MMREAAPSGRCLVLCTRDKVRMSEFVAKRWTTSLNRRTDSLLDRFNSPFVPGGSGRSPFRRCVHFGACSGYFGFLRFSGFFHDSDRNPKPPLPVFGETCPNRYNQMKFECESFLAF